MSVSIMCGCEPSGPASDGRRCGQRPRGHGGALRSVVREPGGCDPLHPAAQAGSELPHHTLPSIAAIGPRCSTPTSSSPSHEVRQLTEEWLRAYNYERPHDRLGQVPPPDVSPEKGNCRSVYFRRVYLTGDLTVVRQPVAQTGSQQQLLLRYMRASSPYPMLHVVRDPASIPYYSETLLGGANASIDEPVPVK